MVFAINSSLYTNKYIVQHFSHVLLSKIHHGVCVVIRFTNWLAITIRQTFHTPDLHP